MSSEERRLDDKIYVNPIYRATARDVMLVTSLAFAWQNCTARMSCIEHLPQIMCNTGAFSDYYFSLDAESKKRYLQKISLFQGQDPYTLKTEALSQCEDYFK